jgi:hypothetical protein
LARAIASKAFDKSFLASSLRVLIAALLFAIAFSSGSLGRPTIRALAAMPHSFSLNQAELFILLVSIVGFSAWAYRYNLFFAHFVARWDRGRITFAYP